MLQPTVRAEDGDRFLEGALANQIDPAMLRRLLRYEPETGKLFWLPRTKDDILNGPKRRTWNTRYAGKPALDSPDGAGYRHGGICGQKILAHTAAWVLATGNWPKAQIDHIDGDRSNNRIHNLRDVTCGENNKNLRLPKTNKSGVAGVSWDQSRRQWYASISAAGRTIPLGRFDEIESAVAARLAAQREMGFHQNHGRPS